MNLFFINLPTLLLLKYIKIQTNTNSHLVVAPLETNWSMALGSHQPYRLVSLKKVSPFLAMLLQSCGIVAASFQNTKEKNTQRIVIPRNLKVLNRVMRIYASHLDVKSCFCTCLYEYYSKITSFVIPFLYRHLPVKWKCQVDS